MTSSEHVPDIIYKAQERLESVLRRQFNRTAALSLLSVSLVVVVFVGIAVLLRPPKNDPLLRQMQQANQQLADAARALPNSSSSPVPPELVSAIVTQSELHKQAAEAIREDSREISPTAISAIQLIGGAAVVALLGFLGLQRLQNIDVEIQGLRDFMFAQIRERIAEEREVLTAQVEVQVGARFRETRSEMERLTDEFRQQSESSLATLRATASEIEARIRGVEESSSALFTKYAWLEEPDVRDKADQIGRFVSVSQAHSAAQRFRIERDPTSARLALHRIVEAHLPGDTDNFHNAHVEASRLEDPELALQIAEEGLRAIPDHYDLVADKAQSLTSLGKPQEAIEVLEDLRTRDPAEFSRGWRPVVFYADAVQAGRVTQANADSLKQALDQVTTRLPHEAKAWSAYGRFLLHVGEQPKAEAVLKDGLTHNPFNQELNYILGEHLLALGRTTEALEFLKASFAADFQSQYQHDVNQLALRETLAEAYEANEQYGEAIKLYASILAEADQSTNYNLVQYAKNRLQAIGLQTNMQTLQDLAQELVNQAKSGSQDLEETEDVGVPV